MADDHLEARVLDIAERYGCDAAGLEELRQALPHVGQAAARRYRIVDSLGGGGMGEVHLAEDLHTRRRVVLKVPRSGQDEARFRREALITAGLDHPGVVPVFDVGTLPSGRPFYVMPHVQGCTLAVAIERWRTTRLKDSTQLRRLVEALARVAGTLEVAHASGVVHRDVTPDNIILGEQGEVVLLDWGVAHVQGEAAARLEGDPAPRGTAAGHGTQGFMCPAQAAGHPATPAFDLWALGAVLALILTGRAPPTVDDPALRAGALRPRLRPLASVALLALTDPPAADLDARGLRRALQAWLDDLPVPGHRPDAVERTLRLARRHGRALVPVAAAAVVALVLLVLLVAARRDEAATRLGAQAGRWRELAERRLQEHDPLSALILAGAAAELSGTEDPALAGLAVEAASAWTPALVTSVETGAGCHQLAWSLDGAWLACAAYDVEGGPPPPLSWLSSTEGPLRSLDLGSTVRAVSFDPAGAMIAVTEEGALWRVSPEQGQAESWGRTAVPSPEVLAFIPPDHFAIGSRDPVLEVRSWPENTVEHTWNGRGTHTFSQNLIPDGHGGLLVRTGERRIERYVPGQGLVQVVVDRSDVEGAALSPDGSRLAVAGYPLGGDRRVRLWNVTTGQLAGESLELATVSEVAWSPDGSLLAVAGRSAWVHLLDPRNLDEALRLPTFHPGSSGHVRSMAVSSTGRLAVATSTGGLHVWDLSGYAPPPCLDPYLRSVAFADAGRLVALCDRDATFRVYDRATWELLAEHRLGPAHQCLATGLPSSAVFWVATRGGVARWEEHRGVVCHEPTTVDRDVPYAVVPSSDGARVAVGGFRGEGRGLLEVRGPDCAILGRRTDLVTSAMGVAWLDDGTLAFTDVQGRVARWRLDDGSVQTLAADPLPKGGIAGVAGGHLVYGRRKDHLLTVLHPGTASAPRTLAGHTDWPLFLTADATGRWLVSAGWDPAARVWDVPAGRARLSLPAAPGPLIHLAMDPTTRLVSTVHDGQARPRLVHLAHAEVPVADLARRLDAHALLAPVVLGDAGP